MIYKIQEWVFTGFLVFMLSLVWASERILGLMDYEEQDYVAQEKCRWFKFKK
jgi:hypothetical protein